MEGLAAKPCVPFCCKDSSTWCGIFWSSRILSTFAQPNWLVTHGNVSNIKSALQNKFLKIQRFGHRNLAHPFWPEVNPEVLINAIILSKYGKQQAVKREMISFLVSYRDLQMGWGPRARCNCLSQAPAGLCAHTQLVLGLLTHIGMEHWHAAMAQSWDCLW